MPKILNIDRVQKVVNSMYIEHQGLQNLITQQFEYKMSDDNNKDEEDVQVHLLILIHIMALRKTVEEFLPSKSKKDLCVRLLRSFEEATKATWQKETWHPIREITPNNKDTDILNVSEHVEVLSKLFDSISPYSIQGWSDTQKSPICIFMSMYMVASKAYGQVMCDTYSLSSRAVQQLEQHVKKLDPDKLNIAKLRFYKFFGKKHYKKTMAALQFASIMHRLVSQDKISVDQIQDMCD